MMHQLPNKRPNDLSTPERWLFLTQVADKLQGYLPRLPKLVPALPTMEEQALNDHVVHLHREHGLHSWVHSKYWAGFYLQHPGVTSRTDGPVECYLLCEVDNLPIWDRVTTLVTAQELRFMIELGDLGCCPPPEIP